MFDIKFDENAFKRAIGRQIEASMKDIAASYTREMNQLSQRYVGRPVEEIKPVLQRLFSKDGGSITEPELTEYAEHISAGETFTFTTGNVRW